MTVYHVERTGDVPLVVDGELLADVTSRRYDDQVRWTEIRIYKNSRGGWVTETVGQSTIPDETIRIAVNRHTTPEDVRNGLRLRTDTRSTYLTKLAISALREAASNDPALEPALTEPA